MDKWIIIYFVVVFPLLASYAVYLLVLDRRRKHERMINRIKAYTERS